MLDDYHEIVHIMIRVPSSGRRFVLGAKHGVINRLGHVTRELAQLLGWSITTFFSQATILSPKPHHTGSPPLFTLSLKMTFAWKAAGLTLVHWTPLRVLGA